MEVTEFPKRIEIEIASACNLKCIFCPRHYIDKLNGFMSFELFKKIIDETEKYPDTILVLHRRGESLLHPKFTDMLKYIRGKFKEVQIATNATLLTKEKFKVLVDAITFISFSIDIPERFNNTRIPAKYEIVEKNILNFLEFNNGKIKTQVSMVKTDDTTEDMCNQFIEIWKNKVDRIRIYEEHSKNGKFGSIKNPRETRKTCVMPFYEILIYDNGLVGRCNHDWIGEKHSMGDVNKNTIKEIWFNEKYHKLRKQQLSLLIKDSICKNCDSWYPEVGKQGTGIVVEK